MLFQTKQVKKGYESQSTDSFNSDSETLLKRAFERLRYMNREAVSWPVRWKHQAKAANIKL